MSKCVFLFSSLQIVLLAAARLSFYPSYGFGQVGYSRFFRAFFHWKQLPAPSGNDLDGY